MSAKNSPDSTKTSHRSAMEGGGFYNRHSAMQAAGISLVLDDWERIVRETVIEGPIVIVDYGASQGRNSMAPMRIVIEELRARLGDDKPIQVIHTDLPSNDFAALFALLEDDPTSYMKVSKNVYPLAVGRSYFSSILPPSSVNLGWNTWTAHWFSSPVLTPDHVFPGLSQDENVLRQVEIQQAEDWRKFLESRAEELKSGALMLSASVGRASDGTGWNWIGDHFWGAIKELGAEGLLTDDEMLRMTVPAHGRTVEQIREPFGASGTFKNLRLVKSDLIPVPDGAWNALQNNGDAKQFGITHSNMIRGFSGPTISAAMNDRADKAAVNDRLFARFAERMAADPKIHAGFLAVVVLQKE